MINTKFNFVSQQWSIFLLAFLALAGISANSIAGDGLNTNLNHNIIMTHCSNGAAAKSRTSS